MNLAFQALVIFVLVLPGITLRYTYRKGLWDRPPIVRPVSEEVAYSLIIACLIHTVFGPLANCLYPVDLRSIAYILIGNYGKDSARLEPTVLALVNQPFRILIYLLVTISFAAIAGFASHWAIRRFRLDHRLKFLRFDNHWHYLLSGEISEFRNDDLMEGKGTLTVEGAPGPKAGVDDISLVLVACVVELGGKGILYFGVLDYFFFDRKGELEIIVLRGAMRKQLYNESGAVGRAYYLIDSDYIYLKFADVRNLSVRFVTSADEEKILEQAKRRDRTRDSNGEEV